VRWCGSSRPHSSETRSLHASSRQLSAGETSQQLACRHSWHVNTITHTALTCMLCQCCAIMTHSANDGHVEQNKVLWTHVCSLRALAAMPCVFDEHASVTILQSQALQKPCGCVCCHRLQHLELIRERAALGKDFDRRDSFTGGPSSGRQSPMVGDRPASRLGRPVRSPVQPEGAGNGCNSSSEAEEQTGHSRRACVSRLNIQAASFCPPDAADISAECSQASVSQFSTASGATASPGLLPCDVFSQLQGNSQSIPAAGLFAAPTSVKASMKGARRRMAKAKHRMQQPGYVTGSSTPAHAMYSDNMYPLYWA
jgi:hypothetical protein